MKVDHIIVGQGLAGSCLAFQLLKQNKKIVVFDEPTKNHSSAVAAGLFNPISGKWMTKAWMADEVFTYLFKFYREAEEKLDVKFLIEKPVYRPFISVEEQNEWMARSADRGLKDFIERVYTSSTFGRFVDDPFGGIIAKYSGYLDVPVFMNAITQLLQKEKSYHESFFNHEKLQITTQEITYENIQAKSIIFCDGFSAKSNPYFRWLPIRALKGETLSVSLSEQPDIIFNRGIYLSPHKNSFILGATYKPNENTPGNTSEGRAELEEKAHKLLKIKFEVHHHNWGIRPTTHDRKPILGAHPKHSNVLIFNGLGTKGVSLAPFFSEILANHLETGIKIPTEVNIERFKALYSSLSSD